MFGLTGVVTLIAVGAGPATAGGRGTDLRTQTQVSAGTLAADDSGRAPAWDSGQPRDGTDGPAGTRTEPRTTTVPCDADRLVAAIDRANRTGGGLLRLASNCAYALTDHRRGSGLPPITQSVTVVGDRTTVARAPGTEPFRIATVAAGGRLTLDGLTLRGGHSAPDTDGGALLVRPGGTATVTHSAIVDNTGGRDGGGIANLGKVTIKNSAIARNDAERLGGGLHNTNSATVTTSRIADNTTTTDGGAGIASIAGELLVHDSTISGNSTALTGAAGIGIGPGSAATVTHSRITDNTAAEEGGGLFTIGSRVTLRHVVVARNHANIHGGGLYLIDDSEILIDDSVIADNTAEGDGGGFHNDSGTVTARRTFVKANRAVGADSRAGGVYNTGDGDVTLVKSRVTRNVSTLRPGGILNDAGEVTLDRTRVADNRPTNCRNVPGC
ncbi:right-handed parallel beta-helix repeat-containing protein [Micromonospora sp. WMMA1363]|uniref:right-handed parallel beta-helix repeat-containing protein n=1 Tax=Micromonospora sp. WMMA1363 TaxID=3053985 RepID=UPI00259D1A2B|nr:right-handed parallel beta-helix repeat-containing protein [Micromonospora sp. WMMA1363]MDM4719037.1 right-handed parallel beta-helix repeat-containing protein [Micromonospora sp. WMMA1363]